MECTFGITFPEFVLSEKITDSAYNVFSTNNTRTPFKGQIEGSSDPASCSESDSWVLRKSYKSKTNTE